ncbi:hypothetical protein D3C73_868170 [compost metagenome]
MLMSAKPPPTMPGTVFSGSISASCTLEKLTEPRPLLAWSSSAMKTSELIVLPAWAERSMVTVIIWPGVPAEPLRRSMKEDWL